MIRMVTRRKNKTEQLVAAPQPPAGAHADTALKAKATEAQAWPWHPIVAIVAAVLLFVAAQLVAGVFGAIIFSTAQQSGVAVSAAWQQFVFVLLAEGLTVAGLGMLLRRNGKTFRSLGLYNPQFKDILMAAIAFAVYYLLLGIIVSIVSTLIPSLNVSQKQDIGFDKVQGFAALMPAFISLVILAPVAEEILFRGFVFKGLRARYRFMPTAIVTSLIFGGAHLLGGEQGAALLWVAGIDTFVLSLVLCYLRERTGRLWPGIGLHALKNLVAFILLFVVQSSR